MNEFVIENFYGKNVNKLLPHQPPFVLISELVEMVENKAITRFDIPKTHILVKNGHLAECGLLENFAQTAALSAGFAHFAHSKTNMANYLAPLGYMGSIKKISIERTPHYSEIIETRTSLNRSIKTENKEVVFCEGEIFSNKGNIASGEFKIFLLYR